MGKPQRGNSGDAQAGNSKDEGVMLAEMKAKLEAETAEIEKTKAKLEAEVEALEKKKAEAEAPKEEGYNLQDERHPSGQGIPGLRY